MKLKEVKMLRYLRIYLHFVKASIQLFMSHRFNFLMGALANILWTISQLITLQYLFSKIPSYEGWTIADLVLLLGFGQVFVYMSYAVFDLNLDQLHDKIVNGSFDRMLTKPINILFLASFESFSVATIVPMLTTVVPLILYGLLNRHALSGWVVLAAFIVIILGVIILYLVSLSVSGLVFFFEDIQALKEFVILRVNDLTRIPLTVFPKMIQYAFTFVIPVAFVAFYPAQIIRNQAKFLPALGTEILLLILFSYIAKRIWYSGLKRYSGLG